MLDTVNQYQSTLPTLQSEIESMGTSLESQRRDFHIQLQSKDEELANLTMQSIEHQRMTANLQQQIQELRVSLQVIPEMEKKMQECTNLAVTAQITIDNLRQTEQEFSQRYAIMQQENVTLGTEVKKKTLHAVNFNW